MNDVWRAQDEHLDFSQVHWEELAYLMRPQREPTGTPRDWPPSTGTIDPGRWVHALKADERPSALCLSGGGIRSATFSLGVLQGLSEPTPTAQSDNGPAAASPGDAPIDRFHYLSTVSGGGFIGSWLMAWRARQRAQDGGAASPLHHLLTPPPGLAAGPEPEAVSKLRAYSNYLSPKLGFSGDMLALLTTYVRNLLLNWLIMLPFLAALLLLPWVMQALLNMRPNPCPLAGLGAVLLIVAGAAGVSFAGKADSAQIPLTSDDERAARRLQYLCVIAPCLVGAALLSIALPGLEGLYKAWLAFPLVIGALTLTSYLLTGLTSRLSSPDALEWWARTAGICCGFGLAWLLLAGIVLALPYFVLSNAAVTTKAGAGAASLGLISAVAGFWSKYGERLDKQGRSWLSLLGIRLVSLAAMAFCALLAAFASLALALLLASAPVEAGQAPKTDESAHALPGERPANQAPADCNSASDQEHRVCTQTQTRTIAQPGGIVTTTETKTTVAAPKASAPADLQKRFEAATSSAPLKRLAASLAGLLLLGGIASFAIGANDFSLNNMYGNRLVRAYLGASRRNAERRPNPWTGFDPQDNPRLAAMQAPEAEPRQRRPLHIINAAVNLVQRSGQRLEWQQRKAASFTMSPLHCGYEDGGYVRAERYGDQQGMSLGRALSISGAAASPNMGYHSSAAITFILSLFNIRLGWWLPNTSRSAKPVWGRRSPAPHDLATLREALGLTTDTSRFVYVSDGGHFENLGLYEMVRRRCHKILVVDASCDPEHLTPDLERTVRKIQIDFGIRIEFPEGPINPAIARKTHRHFTVARIHYGSADVKNNSGAPAEDGYLLYVKPLLSGDEPFELRAYARTSPGQAFPHETTADQFFNETQFESYRALGRHSVSAALLAAWADPEAWLQQLDEDASASEDASSAKTDESKPGGEKPAEAHGKSAETGASAGKQALGGALKQGLTSGAGPVSLALGGAVLTGALMLNVNGTVRLETPAKVTLEPSSLTLQQPTPDNGQLDALQATLTQVQLELAQLKQRVADLPPPNANSVTTIETRSTELQTLQLRVEALAVKVDELERWKRSQAYATADQLAQQERRLREEIQATRGELISLIEAVLNATQASRVDGTNPKGGR